MGETPAILAEGLVKPYGKTKALAGLDLVVPAGPVYGLLGPNGAGNLRMIGQRSRLTASAARRRADEMRERFGLTEAAGRAVKTYSGGMRRRLDLAASLIGYPSVLFLDEPTTGLDQNARAMTWEIVRGLADSGTTLLLTTQYLDEADQLAGRIAVIDGGTVIAEGTPDQLKSSLGGEHLEVM